MTSDIASTGQLYSLLGWIDKNRKQIISTVVILVVVGLVVAFVRWRDEQTRIQGGERLTTLLMEGGAAGVKADVLIKVADDYAGTEVGARALLRAAEQLFTEGKIAEAQSAFTRFAGEYAGSPLVSQAKFGVAVCLDSQGKTAEAVTAFKEVADRYPDKNTATLAKYHLAVIYEAQGKMEMARDLYMDLARGGRSTIGSEAGLRLNQMFEKDSSLIPTQPVAPPVAPPTTAP